jgi:cell division septum initiation protein DivIVA
MFQEIKFEEFIELWGERFSRSKLGLNEDQVKAFIGRLIGEREILLERDRQFREIALKAEKITLEADKIAIEARKKAEEQAKLILDGAREQAEKLVRQKLVEAETAARQEAELIKKEAVAAAQKCIDEAEGKAQANAKAIIMKALVEGNEIIEKKRAEAGDVGRDGTEAIETDLLAAAKRLLANASEEAEAQAQAQAEAILSSKKTTGEP